MTFDELFAEHRLTAAERAELVRFLALLRYERTIKVLTAKPQEGK